MPTQRAPTSEQLRRAIDSGRTADKVDSPDPAAAPLGADDEAAGSPPTATERELARRAPAPPQGVDRQAVGAGGYAAVVAVLVALVAAGLWYWSR